MMIATKIDDYDSPATPHPQQAPREFFFFKNYDRNKHSWNQERNY